MSRFLFPRTVSVRRPNARKAAGEQGYGGLAPDDEKTLHSNLPAHIQVDRQGIRPTAGLPGDTLRSTQWKIILKSRLGDVRQRDVIVDEIGNRYQVVSAAWGPMCTTCVAELLET